MCGKVFFSFFSFRDIEVYTCNFHLSTTCPLSVPSLTDVCVFMDVDFSCTATLNKCASLTSTVWTSGAQYNTQGTLALMCWERDVEKCWLSPEWIS